MREYPVHNGFAHVGDKRYTVVEGIKSIRIPEIKPVLTDFLDDDDVITFADADGVRWSVGLYADGTYYKQRR